MKPTRHRDTDGAEDARAGGVELPRGQSTELDEDDGDTPAEDRRSGLHTKQAGWLHELDDGDDEGDGNTHARGQRGGLRAKQAGWLDELDEGDGDTRGRRGGLRAKQAGWRSELDEGDSDTHAGGRRGGLRAKQAGWLDELDDEEGDFLDNTPVQGVVYGRLEDTRAGGTIDIAHKAPSDFGRGQGRSAGLHSGGGSRKDRLP